MLPRLLVIAMVVGCAATVCGQSLNEAAAKEKERRQKKGTSAKSYSEADLEEAAKKRTKEGTSSSSEVPPPASSASAAPSKPTAAPPAGTTADSTESQVAQQKARGAEYKARLDVLGPQIQRAEEQLAAAEKDARMANSHPWEMASSADAIRARLETAKKTLQRLRNERDEVELAARREGIPPGYMR